MTKVRMQAIGLTLAAFGGVGLLMWSTYLWGKWVPLGLALLGLFLFITWLIEEALTQEERERTRRQQYEAWHQERERESWIDG